MKKKTMKPQPACGHPALADRARRTTVVSKRELAEGDRRAQAAYEATRRRAAAAPVSAEPVSPEIEAEAKAYALEIAQLVDEAERLAREALAEAGLDPDDLEAAWAYLREREAAGGPADEARYWRVRDALIARGLIAKLEGAARRMDGEGLAWAVAPLRQYVRHRRREPDLDLGRRLRAKNRAAGERRGRERREERRERDAAIRDLVAEYRGRHPHNPEHSTRACAHWVSRRLPFDLAASPAAVRAAMRRLHLR